MRHLGMLGYRAEGDAVEAVAGKQIEGGIQDSLPDCLPLSFVTVLFGGAAAAAPPVGLTLS